MNSMGMVKKTPQQQINGTMMRQQGSRTALATRAASQREAFRKCEGFLHQQ
jgi:hypothetical protein